MNTITIVDGSFCATRNGEVLGIIRRCGVDQWGFYQVVPGVCGESQYFPLEHALRVARHFEPFPPETETSRPAVGFIRGVSSSTHKGV